MSFFNLNGTRFSNREISPGHTTFSLCFFFGGGADFIYSIFYIVTCVSESTLSASIFKLTSIILLRYFSILNLAVLPRRPFCIPFGCYFFWNRITEFLTEVFRRGPSFPVHLNLCLPAAWSWGVLGKKDKQSSDKDVLATVLHAGVNFPKWFFQLGRGWRWAVESVHGILDLPPHLQCIWCAP